MKREKRYIRETLFLVWPYILIVLVTAAIFLAGTAACYQIISKNAEQAAHNQITVLSDAVYDQITSYKNACAILVANSAVLSFPNESGQDEYETQTMVHTLQREFNNVMSLAHVPYTNIEIYYPQKQAIITMTREYWGEARCRERFEEQSGGALSQEYLEKIPIEHSLRVQYEKGSAFFIHRLTQRGKTIAYLILECSLSQLVPVSGEEGIVLIGDDNTLHYSSDDQISEDLSKSIMKQSRENHRFQYNGEKYISYRCFYNLMQTEIWIAISVNRIVAGTAAFRTTMLVLGIACFVSFALIFLNMYKRIILPYQYLAEATNLGSDGGDVQNVLTMARSNLMSLKSQQKAAEAERKLLIYLGVGDLLQQIRTVPAEHVLDLSKRCLSLAGIRPGQRYMVFSAFHMSDQEQVFKDMQTIQEQITPRFVIDNVLQDLLFSDRVGVISNVEQYFVIISTCHEGDTEESLNEIVNRLTEFYQKSYRVTIAATRPMIGKSPEELHSIITKTMNDITYLYFWQKDRVGEIENTETEGLISYFKAMRNMINRLDNQDYQGAQAIFRQIMDDSLSHNTLDFQITKYRIYGMMEMLVAAISEQSALREDILTELDFEQRLYETDTIASFRMTAEQIFMKVIDIRQQDDNKESGKKKIEHVKAYIDSRYMENGLTATSVAEHFGVSSSYISREFKRIVGCNVLEYIQRLRVEQAKKLLLDHSVKDAALQSGFWDTQSLVRVFKKYEGVTPGEYKKSIEQ